MDTVQEIFLSIVVVADNQRQNLERFLTTASSIAQECATDHEIVVVENGSADGSIELLRMLCGEQGIPNLQVYRLAKKVEADLAAWAGVENALGDYVAVIDPTRDDLRALPELLAASVAGADVVFGVSRASPRRSMIYRILNRMFGAAVGRLLGIDANKEMPFFRVLSRTVVNYMLQHQASGLAYRWLPAASGFHKTTVCYERSIPLRRSRLLDDIDRGARLLISSTFGPLRVVTLLCFFGAIMNVLYSIYVVAIALIKDEVAPGWVTLSLQQSGMFFLFSVVLLVLGEYVLYMSKLAANAPSYYVTEEFTSSLITRRKRLNVEVSATAEPARVRREPTAVADEG